MRPGSRTMWLVTLAAVLMVAAWLRIEGLAFGLPAVYNPDEIAIMSRALGFARGDLNPHNFLYPTFYFYVLFGWIGAYFAGAWALGHVPSAAAFQAQFFSDPSAIYLAGRALGVVCGVATVAAVAGLGRRLFDRQTGLYAAVFMAVAPTAVRDAHYVKHDVPVTLAIVAAMLAMATVLRAEPGQVRRKALGAGALCGVAFSTHYYSVFLALPLVLCTWGRESHPSLHPSLHPVRDRVSALAGAFGAAAIVFFALSPFLLVEPATAWQDIVANRQIVMDRAVTGPRGMFASAPAYLQLIWNEALGWPVVLAALAGMALSVRHAPRQALLLLAFAVPFLAFISNTVAASRYLNPILPALSLFAAYAVRKGVGSLFSLKTPDPSPAWLTVTDGLGIAAAVLLAWPGLRDSTAIGRFFAQTDVRTVAQRYIEEHVPAGATILVQPYSVQLEQSREGLLEALDVHGISTPSPKFAGRLALDPYPAPAYRTIFLGDGGLDADKIYVSLREVDGTAGLEPVRRIGVQYVVLKRYNTEDLAVAPLRTMLAADGRRVAEFSPYRPDADAHSRARVAPFLHNTDTPYDPVLERPGPGVEIWAVAAPR